MSENETKLSRALGEIEHIGTRLNRFEDENLDTRDAISELASAQSRVDATLVILNSQMKQITNQPSRTGSIVMAVGVGVSIMALALTPVAWLAVNNNEQLDEQMKAQNTAAEARGEMRARIELSEMSMAVHNQLSGQQYQQLQERIQHLERVRMFGK